MRVPKRLSWLIIGIMALIGVLYALSMIGIEPGQLLETTFMAMTPLILAAVGECLNEKAGVVNVGLEGIFLITAVTGVYWAEVVGNGVGGLIIGGAIIGGIIGLLFGIISTYGKAAQVVAGMGLNVFGLGFVPFLLVALWAFPGIHMFDPSLVIRTIDIPVGGGIFRLSPVPSSR